ncbi:hypothetical protein EDEG_03316 [Edhazardia aedis USNM 41457]|uniref:Uncharacterized protein n=1 Tax=Edhazardia aedis (strain USNM 41457) TaxID=1003232 RepID=J9D341_EDHAE|nr:hypothetical protein EDEG_03316 [Edhazardia aedis USNM 41457]|eukprot:EJW02246.1 hypothetical protein EDEG_03316 [Edhazardia aedis USNM 41457]
MDIIHIFYCNIYTTKFLNAFKLSCVAISISSSSHSERFFIMKKIIDMDRNNLFKIYSFYFLEKNNKKLNTAHNNIFIHCVLVYKIYKEHFRPLSCLLSSAYKNN